MKNEIVKETAQMWVKTFDFHAMEWNASIDVPLTDCIVPTSCPFKTCFSKSHIAAIEFVGSLSISTWNCTHRFRDDVSVKHKFQFLSKIIAIILDGIVNETLKINRKMCDKWLNLRIFVYFHFEIIEIMCEKAALVRTGNRVFVIDREWWLQWLWQF